MTPLETVRQIRDQVNDVRSGKPIHECSAHYIEGIFKLLCVLAEANLSAPTPKNVPIQDAVDDLMGPEPKKKTNGRRGRPAIKSR